MNAGSRIFYGVDSRVLKHALDPSCNCILRCILMFYAKLNSIVDQCAPRDTLIVLGDFNAVSGTERVGYEMCVGPHGSGIRNVNSSFLLDFAKSRRLRIGGSWFQRREPRRLAWYSNDGVVVKEVDHILVSSR